jgi:TolB-like protein/class 3 adenylate cyclase/Tfp pilus assembly protein PilF
VPTGAIERHLAAIVATDVVGYARLMGADEKGTLLALRALRAELIDPLIAAHKGEIIKTIGDGLLLSFPSVVEAVSCAIAVQSGVAKRNAGIPAERRIELRIGVNIGDIIVEKGDVFGDGVNIAARLEQIATPGGICLSEDAYRQVRGKLEIPIADAGEQRLKNIANPIRIYQIEPSVAAAADVAPPAEPGRRWSARAVAGVGGSAIIAAVLLAAGIWFALLREPASISRRAEPPKPAAVSAMPIIAVLPFANQTGDDAQDYFAEGVTDEVIDALGRFNTLRVIGRNAVARYKKRPPTQEEITSDLGANYLVAGSVRHSGNRVRVAAQLADSRSGTVMWSDRYDGELTDIFEFQDTIARRIAGTLAANVAVLEGRRQLDHPRPDATAFDLVLRARAIGHGASRTANRQFRELISKAIELDPNYAAAHALMAEALYSLAVLGWTEFPDREVARGTAEARKAIALAPDEPDGYRALGRLLVAGAEYDQAQNALKRAIEINPSDASALAEWGSVQSFSGEIGAAIESLELALKLDPALEPKYAFDLAVAYYLARRHSDALRTAERGLARYPDFPMFDAAAAAASAQLGRKEEANRYVEALRRRVPFLDLDALGSRFKDPSHSAYLREGLKAAGL